MTKPIHVSADTARLVMLAAHGLMRRPARRATKIDVLNTIRQMGALQIDTINVVARSPYLVLWSRLGQYKPQWLDELLAEGALFEYWAHAACFLPIEDFGLFRHRMLDFVAGARSPRMAGWISAHRGEMDAMLTHIRENGSVRSADFEHPEPGRSGWWGWKPDKRVLEALHTSGEAMIARREHFQRVYDLRERVLPSWTDENLPPREEADRALALKAVRALGITTARWLADYFRTERRISERLMESLVDDGVVLAARVESWNGPAYLDPSYVELLPRSPRPTLTTLLSPFDPLVWDRERARAVFGFDYTIECYTPAPKRRYGYFTLPILHRGRLIGRLDPKAHRADGIFEVRAIFLEPDLRVSESLVRDVADAIRRCALWHATPTVVVRRSEPDGLAGALQRALGAASEMSSDYPAD